MDLAIGIETRDEYLDLEVAKGAMTMVRDVLLVKPGETVLITADTSSDKRVADAFAKAAYAIDAMPVIINYPTAPCAVMDPPAPIAGAVERADVWIELSLSYIMHTKAFQNAIAAGVRYICLTGMDVEMLVNTVTKVNYNLMIELGEHFKEILGKANKIEVKSKNGTDLIAYHQGRKIRHSGQRATQKGYPIMLGGQTSWCPVEETINGTLVFDGALWPPAEIGKLHEPVKLTLENGVVTKIEGGAQAETFKAWLESYNDENSYRLAHYSQGFNPGVTKPTGRIVEDERVFGCMEFGIGSQGKAIMGACWDAPSHTDGILLKPTIILDDVVIEEDGVYKDPVAVEICKKMGIAGY